MFKLHKSNLKLKFRTRSTEAMKKYLKWNIFWEFSVMFDVRLNKINLQFYSVWIEFDKKSNIVLKSQQNF